eukprot:6248665-Alexandrium_andersonii.AAC.1
MADRPGGGSVSELAAEPAGKGCVSLPQLVPCFERKVDEAARLAVVGTANHGRRDDKQTCMARTV